MLPALLDIEMWHQFNDNLGTLLDIRSPLQIRYSPSVATSLFEVTSGLTHFFAHKKNLGFVKGQTPHFHPFLSYFYKETYQFSKTGPQIFQNSEEWVANLPNDTLFVVFAEDHCITGELYPWEELDNHLNNRKIFSIRISHSSHRFHKTRPLPFSIRLCALENDLGCVSLLGERVRSPVIFSHTIPMDRAKVEQVKVSIQECRPLNPKLILAFERQFIDIGTPFFTASNVERLFDRSVISFKNINGNALLQKMITKNPIHQNLIAAVNLCSSPSHNPQLYTQWWSEIPNESTLRGLVVISATLLEKSNFNLVKEIRDAYFEASQQQIWS